MDMFWAIANPIVLNGSGNRGYCTNQHGVVYFTQQALVTDVSLRDDAIIPTAMSPIR